MKTPKANRDEVRENSFTVTATKAEKEEDLPHSHDLDFRRTRYAPLGHWTFPDGLKNKKLSIDFSKTH